MQRSATRRGVSKELLQCIDDTWLRESLVPHMHKARQLVLCRYLENFEDLRSSSFRQILDPESDPECAVGQAFFEMRPDLRTLYFRVCTFNSDIPRDKCASVAH